jgi:hypothetical protein
MELNSVAHGEHYVDFFLKDFAQVRDDPVTQAEAHLRNGRFLARFLAYRVL